ncbi:hypothetical protein RZS08_57390, partial [Arthrospira platensis SPKY1]|nr:hypothetical protein [Arthrospira platensis SPKY1]
APGIRRWQRLHLATKAQTLARERLAHLLFILQKHHRDYAAAREARTMRGKTADDDQEVFPLAGERAGADQWFA